MRKLALALFILVTAVPGAWAGVRDAVDAYDKGDYATALAACKSAAEQGDASCQNFLGILFARGKGVPKDDAEAVKWYRRAADQGNGYAQLNLGFAYEQGHGVPRNDAEAAKWYLAAANQHIPQAQLALGLFRLRVDHDEREAVKWIRLAARQGLPLAQLALGGAYETGRGIKKNDRQAAKWFLLSAEGGDGAGQASIARLYEQGIGVEKDLPESYFWYAVANKNSTTPDRERKAIQDALKRLSAKLAPKQIAEAESAAKGFHPDEGSVGGRRSAGSPTASGGPRLFSTGSGFYVTTAGHLVSNNHVVADCTTVRVSEGESSVPVKVLATDPDRDLALLQLPHGVATAVAFRDGSAKLGENVVVMGYPLTGLITSDAVVTTGIVSALAGPRDDRHLMQISAPVQPGNSGGPLLDGGGHLVGVVVSTLNRLKIAQLTGAIPENISFAIKSEDARAFLKSHNVAVAASPLSREISTAAIADQALKYTVRLECWK
jgi:uncharacterized protein